TEVSDSPYLHDALPILAAAFEQVVSAYHQKQTNILYALAYAVEKIPSAEADATNILAQARNAAVTRVALAAGEAARFTNQMVARSEEHTSELQSRVDLV